MAFTFSPTAAAPSDPRDSPLTGNQSHNLGTQYLQKRGDIPFNYVMPPWQGRRPFDDTDPASPEGRFMATYRAMTPFKMGGFGAPDQSLVLGALANLFGGGVQSGIGADAQLRRPGFETAALNQFEDAELARRPQRMGQDLNQQRALDNYQDEYAQRQLAGGNGQIQQLLEQLALRKAGGNPLQQRIGGGAASPLMQALDY